VRPSDRPRPGTMLSDREMQVMRGLALGHTRERVASDLGITRATVGEHLKRVSVRLDSRNTVNSIHRLHLLGLLGDQAATPTREQDVMADKVAATFHPNPEPSHEELVRRADAFLHRRGDSFDFAEEQAVAEHEEAVADSTVFAEWTPLEQLVLHFLNNGGIAVHEHDPADGNVKIEGTVNVRSLIAFLQDLALGDVRDEINRVEEIGMTPVGQVSDTDAVFHDLHPLAGLAIGGTARRAFASFLSDRITNI
jgi:DNA-binding CsgD family transcriptional regulator